MRVIGGKYRNRRIDPPRAMHARPTTDYAKEGLFNILQHKIPLEGIRVLDLFAGTGSISVEFLSRGASEVVSVEQDRTLTTHMERTRDRLSENGWQVVRSDVFSYLQGRHGEFDIVFADPPFDLARTAELPGLVLDAGLVSADGLLIVEHSKHLDLAALPAHQATRKYGMVHFSLFHPSLTR